MKFTFFFRLLASISVMAILFYSVNLDDLAKLKIVSMGYLFIAGVLAVMDRIVNALRWSILINYRSLNISFIKITSIYFKSGFLGLIMPSSVGGEFLKGYGLMKSGSGAIDSFSSVLVERVLGLIALVVTCVGGFFIFQSQLNAIPAVMVRKIFFAIFILMVLGLILGYFFFPVVARFITPESKPASLLKEIRVSLQYYQDVKTRLFLSLLLSFLVQIIRIYFVWFVGVGLGLTVELPYYFVFLPVISLVSMVPLSIAGLGIQEGAFVYFFSLTGENPAMILGMALAVRILVVGSVLPGGILYLREGMGAKPPSTSVSKNV